ncbi:helix-turn-helix transcriptional regulator [Puia sp.]|jgi:transcriptional regulator with XRE-family HTH domain|uniref:helix-turn-helix domain-containing protein n=1 Tax=Puia sp. TaxID=2045100 RepID=UPI002F3EBD96
MDKKQDALRRLGLRLTAFRRKKHLTLDQLSTLTGLDTREIAAIEAGETDPPLTTLLALAHGLGLSPGELLPGE